MAQDDLIRQIYESMFPSSDAAYLTRVKTVLDAQGRSIHTRPYEYSPEQLDSVIKLSQDPNSWRSGIMDYVLGQTDNPRIASSATNIAEFLPLSGTALGLKDAQIAAQGLPEAVSGGNYGQAAGLLGIAGLGAADAALTMLPFAGPITRGIRNAPDVGRAVVDRLNQPGPMPTVYSNPVMRADQPQGIRAYHGSPHDFERFSMDKIGTGEGAQAYGHGLYFAEAEPVARGYRDALSARAAPNDARGNAFDLVQRMGGDVEATAEVLREGIANTVSPNTEQFLRETLKHIEDRTFADFERPLGSMYEVNINANPEDFLDWDKPLSEQPKKVQEAVEANMPEYKTRNIAGVPHVFANNKMIEINDPNLTGRDAYILSRMGQLGDLTKEQAAAASSALREAGIPGIRYLDAGSRGAGDGSRNYVVFDENLINIVRKYGIAGAAVMLGISQADLAQAMEQQQPQGLLE